MLEGSKWATQHTEPAFDATEQMPTEDPARLSGFGVGTFNRQLAAADSLEAPPPPPPLNPFLTLWRIHVEPDEDKVLFDLVGH